MDTEIRDSFGRRVSYLRISVTDRCNLRCRYCMPPGGVVPKRHEEILRYEEIARAVRAVVSCGINRLRLTGGEPLVRPGIPSLVRMLRELPGVEDISLTTNGQFLARYAGELREAGLSRVNVSLDTLDPERYRDITGGGELAPVLQGLAACRAEGLLPLKVNVVVIRGVNDDQVTDFARWTLEEPYDVRFIEFMPIGDIGLWSEQAVVLESETRAAVETVGPLERAETPATSRGGQAWRLPGARATIAFISPISKPFCAACNRLRLSADGQLRPCLLSDSSVDLRAILRAGGTEADIRRAFVAAAQSKPERHRLGEGAACHPRTPMSAIGG